MQDRPLDMKVPFWATWSFRWLVAAVVMSVAVIAVILFEILPTLERRAKRETPPPKAISARDRAIRFDGVLEKVKDGTPVDMAEEAYQRLVRHLRTVPPDDLAKRAKEVSYVHFARQPQDLRGETVKVVGLLAGTYPIRLDPPVGDLEWVYHTILVDLSGEEGYVLDLIDPVDQRLPRRQLVEVEGIFVKNCSYTAWDPEKEKDVPRTAPFFLGRRMVAVQEKAVFGTAEYMPWVYGLAGAFGLFIVFLSIRAIREARRGPLSSLPVTRIP